MDKEYQTITIERDTGTARRDQMRTYATPTERARVLAENPVEIEEEA